MIAALFVAGLSTSEPPKHIPHALLPLLKAGHRVPVIAGLVMVVLLVGYAFFKLTQLRPSRHRL